MREIYISVRIAEKRWTHLRSVVRPVVTGYVEKGQRIRFRGFTLTCGQPRQLSKKAI